MDSNNEIPSDAPEMCLLRAVVMQAWADLWDAPLSVHEADTGGVDHGARIPRRPFRVGVFH